MTLLYLTAYWHSLAKLRMHTDSSLKVFKHVTIAFGKAMRYFAEETCKQFNTVETASEYAARSRASARRASKKQGTVPGGPVQPDSSASAAGKHPKQFSLFTSKWHALGDYIKQIKLFGTTDSFTTAIVCGGLSFTVGKFKTSDRANYNTEFSRPGICGRTRIMQSRR